MRDDITTKEPTCAAGEEQRTCSVCGHVETREIPATGEHSFGEWIIDKQASCGVAGSKHRTCSVCGETETQTIPALEHNYTTVITKQPTCTTPGEKVTTCSICGDRIVETIPAVDHNWEHHDATGHYEEKVIEEAWTEQKAIWKVVCNGCGAQFDNADEALLHVMLSPAGSGCQNYSSKVVGYETIEHPAVTEPVWVVDTPAYDICTICGTRK